MGSIRPALGISCLHLPRLEAHTGHHTQLGFTWVLRIQSPILMLEWQLFQPLNYLLSSLCSALYYLSLLYIQTPGKNYAFVLSYISVGLELYDPK